MPKYGKSITKRISDLVRADTYTISEICNIVNINRTTYYSWLEEYPEFAQAIKEAEDDRMQVMVKEAKKSLLKKIKGYTFEETKVVSIPGKKKDENGDPLPIIKEQTVKEVHVQPDTAAIIFTLTNGDPDNWQNKQYNEHVGKDGKDLFGNKSDEELDATISDLQRKLENYGFKV